MIQGQVLLFCNEKPMNYCMIYDLWFLSFVFLDEMEGNLDDEDDDIDFAG